MVAAAGAVFRSAPVVRICRHRICLRIARPRNETSSGESFDWLRCERCSLHSGRHTDQGQHPVIWVSARTCLGLKIMGSHARSLSGTAVLGIGGATVRTMSL